MVLLFSGQRGVSNGHWRYCSRSGGDTKNRLSEYIYREVNRSVGFTKGDADYNWRRRLSRSVQFSERSTLHIRSIREEKRI